MYKIDDKNNNIKKIKEESFAKLKYKERENLQERIAKNPNIFGEDLLIIQKEFDGFNDTRERLDLLALDREGNIVIIENKLDNTWRDVVRQSLKYASYCSTLTRKEVIDIFQLYLDKNNIWKNAKEELEKFYEIEDIDEIELNTLQSQRIMMVAWNFRKEVTSTALRLMSYWLNVQCFKATIFAQDKDHFLNIEQIIPIQDAEEYTISMASKQQETVEGQKKQTKRHKIRKQFREKLLPAINKKTSLFSNINPTTDHRISAWSGVSGVVYSFVVTRKYCSIELYPWHKTAEENLKIFDKLLSYKNEIENNFWDMLLRDRLEWKKGTRISYRLESVNIFNEEDHEKMILFLVEYMVKLHTSIDPYLKKIKR